MAALLAGQAWGSAAGGQPPAANGAPALDSARIETPADVVASALGGGRQPATLVSAEVVDLRYGLTFTRETAQRRAVRVTTTFAVPSDAPVILTLPAWTPGAYEISNFARRVRGFSARGAEGQALRWDRVRPGSWRVLPAGAGEVTVSFDFLADTLDNAMSWSRADFLLVNGTNVFLYPEGRPLDFAARVEVRTEADWLVATGMRPLLRDSRGAGPAGQGDVARTFVATSYDELVDMPFFVGRFDLDSTSISGRSVRLATYPVGSVAGEARRTVWEWLRRLIPPQVAVFGAPAWDTYTVMQVSDSTYPGASGLEHANSHVNVVNVRAVLSEFMPSLYAHEVFHAWNVKRIRPAALWPYRYDAPQPTEWLWMSEGITDYYADLSMVRGGVVDAAGFYQLLAARLGEVALTPVVSLEDASIATWVQPLDGSHYIYYAKGALAGLLLDVLIRDATDNRRSLDHVMRALHDSSWGRRRGFTAEDWWGTLSRVAGRDFSDFEAKYIDGRMPLPFDEVLPLAGIRMQPMLAPRLGIASAAGKDGIRVTEVEPGSAAAAAGVRVGDYLISVGEIAVSDAEFGSRFQSRYGNLPEGSPLPLRVRRGTRTIALTAALRFAPIGAHVSADPRASAKARRIREGLLRGRVDR